MRVTLIVAASRNGVIGREGALPWRLPSDLKRFKAETMGKPIIMGRRTWDSLPRKPLPGRLNIVMTRRPDFVADGATVATTVDDALAEAAATGAAEVCVIGGGEIYSAFLDRADQVILTAIDAEIAGDTEFPALPPEHWTCVNQERPQPDPGDMLPYEILTYRRS
jgi:dihydrofolate reductase